MAIVIPLVLVALTMVVACDHVEAETARRQHHMRQRLRDLQTIERWLIAGRLADAKALAYMLARADAPGDRDVARAASALMESTTVTAALHRQVQIAAACARCHATISSTRVFSSPGRPPASYATTRARMLRHQWAADRLWEGLIYNSNEHWRAGLAVFAYTPGPHVMRTDPALETRLRDRAVQAIASHPTDSTEERARSYAELLVTCAACHAKVASGRTHHHAQPR